MAKISVIVPVHNNVEYLDRCLKNLVNQTYKNIEIVLIDDGSTDNSLSACMNYAKSDSRIKLLHQNNEGVAAARNRGIDLATGEYLCFVDNDDFVSKEYCQHLLEMVSKGNAEIGIELYNYIRVDDNNNFYINTNIQPNDDSFDGLYTPIQWMETCYQYRYNFMMTPYTLWGKIFKRQLFKNLRMPINWATGEDSDIIWQLYLKANNIAFNNLRDYVYTSGNPNSLMRKADNQNNDLRILRQQISLFNLMNIPMKHTVDRYLELAKSPRFKLIMSKYTDGDHQ